MLFGVKLEDKIPIPYEVWKVCSIAYDDDGAQTAKLKTLYEILFLFEVF